ncbi:unnamed protein product [Prorocentrum cordatum]|uniref:Reverse transcriptase domain-containing protein n=1 Tax=Prorocentrum cordatum TaxID=2364126 RepID=A0ABN9XIU2_9DINO|nr:unnamed protein product [Polarella glacialis]
MAVAASGQWPLEWQGGDIVSAWKRKGDIRSCDASRGLLLSDHAAKGLAGMVKQSVEPAYEQNVPQDQYGAVRRRGADFATHIVVTVAALAKAMNWSIFILFLDLVKAFDRVVRQLVVGWGEVPAGERLAYLRSLGVAESAAAWIIEYLEERGPLLEQWQVPKTSAMLLRTLHEGAWFRVSGGGRRFESRTGGRQGCKVGSLIFNAAYSVPLDILQWRLKQAGITLKLRVPSGACWLPPDGANDDFQHVLDVTFVDDECVVLTAPSAQTLRAAMDILMETLLGVFDKCHLQLSWEAGESEAVVKFRGHGAVAAREVFRPPDGQLGRPLAKFGHQVVFRFVREYKHLGSYIDHEGMAATNISAHARNALAAYAPLACKFFGSSLVDQTYRLLFFRTLVVSRLLHNMSIFVLSPRAVRKLSGVWMRGLRRIADQMRFSSDVKAYGLSVRLSLAIPSIDCLLTVARLPYLGRVERERPRSLIAALHARPRGQPTPWVAAVRRDVTMLQTFGFSPTSLTSTLGRRSGAPGWPTSRRGNEK